MTEFTPKAPKEYEITERLRVTKKFAVYKGTLDGREAALKFAVDPAFQERLKNEAIGIEATKQIDPNAEKYYIPDLLKASEDYIATEWIDGTLMKEHFTDGDTAAITTDLRTLFDIFSFINQKAPSSNELKETIEGSVARTISRLSALQFENFFDEGLKNKIDEYIVASLQSAEGIIAHGDIQPGNIILQPSRNVPVLIDFETYRPWPRHYNAVNFTFNYLQRYPEYRSSIIKSFEEYSENTGSPAKTSPDVYNFTAALRSTQMIVECLSGEGLSEYTRDFLEHTMQNILAHKPFYADI